MARKTALVSVKQISEINLTPLMDLTFILLITFIITFPLIEQGIPVDLPKGKAEELEPDQTRTISIDIKGLLYLDDIRISNDKLSEELQILGEVMPDTTVFVRADTGLEYGKVVEVMKMLHAANITRMALVTQPESGSIQ